MEKSEELLSVILAGMLLGCPVLPLNENYTESEVLFYLQDIEPKLSILLVQPEDWKGTSLSPDSLGSYKQCSVSVIPEKSEGSEIALFLYTSGTTGTPKGAMISHGNLLACLEGLHQAWHWSSEDRLLHLLPLFHVHGLVVAQFGALYAGAQTILMPKFEAKEAVLLLESKKITICMAVPTIHYRFLQVEHVPDLPDLRLFTSGSAPLPVAIHQEIKAKFGVFKIDVFFLL